MNDSMPMHGGNACPLTTVTAPDVFTSVTDGLETRGWSVIPDFLPPLLISQLRHEVELSWQEGEFRRAGVGRGSRLLVRPEVRTDWVSWLDLSRCSGVQRTCLAALETLRQAINSRLYLGLFDYEGHLAVYPPGTYYHKHLDQFRDIGSRTVTCILYLNADWCAADGGQLRIYTDPQDETFYEEVLPLGGQLVTFLSARFQHEVMPARRNRMSLTGWFRQRS